MKSEQLKKVRKSAELKSDFDRTIFSIFWALAVMINVFRQGAHLDSGLSGFCSISLYVSAAILLMKPSSTFRLQVVAAIGTFEFFLQLPQMANHLYIIGIVNFSLILITLIKKVKGKLSEDWFKDVVPFLRLLFVIIYGAAATAKLNSGFFKEKTSCAYVLANKEFAWMGINIDFNNYKFFPFLLAVTEFAIFFGLLARWTRPYAVVLACIFHTSLSLTPVSQGLGFTFALYGFLNLFLPTEPKIDVINKAHLWQNRIDKKIPMDVFKMIYAIVALFIALAFLVTSVNQSMTLAIRWFATLMLCLVLTVGLIFYVLKFQSNQLVKPVFGIKGIFQAVIVLTVLLTALSPYLGIKTRPTFTMYSNLNVEDNKSNHFLIPRLLPNNLADDVVSIMSSSDAQLQGDAQSGVKWIYLELQRYLSQLPNTAITFSRDGKIYSLAQASDDPTLVNPNAFLAKFLSFRKVYPDEQCAW